MSHNRSVFPMSASPIQDRRWIILIVLTGMAARLWWWAYVETIPVSDFEEFRHLAENLLEYGQLGYPEPSARRLPLYPALLAALMLASHSVTWLSFVNVVLSTALIFVVYRLMLALTDHRSLSLLAAFVCALNPTFIFYSPVLASEHLYSVLLLVSFIIIISRSSISSPIGMLMRPALAGIAFGASVLTRGEAIAYLPVFVFLGLLAQEGKNRKFTTVLISLMAFLSVVTPWYARNQILVGSGSGLSTLAGINFYFAHNEQKYGYQSLEGTSFDGLDEVEKNRLGYQLGIDYLQSSSLERNIRDILRGTERLYLDSSAYSIRWSTALPREDLGADYPARRLKGEGLFIKLTNVYFILLLSAVFALVFRQKYPLKMWAAVYGVVIMNWIAFSWVFWAKARYRFVSEIMFSILASIAIYGLFGRITPRMRSHIIRPIRTLRLHYCSRQMLGRLGGRSTALLAAFCLLYLGASGWLFISVGFFHDLDGIVFSSTDSRGYLALSNFIIGRSSSVNESLIQLRPFLFPLFLAVHNIVGLQGFVIVQLGLNILTLVLVFKSIYKITSSNWLSFSGVLLLAANVTFTFVALHALSESLSFVLIAAALYFMVSYLIDSAKMHLFLTLLLLSAATVAKGIYLPMLVGWAVFTVREILMSGGGMRRQLVWMALGLSPLVIQLAFSYSTAGQASISSAGSLNFDYRYFPAVYGFSKTGVFHPYDSEIANEARDNFPDFKSKADFLLRNPRSTLRTSYFLLKHNLLSRSLFADRPRVLVRDNALSQFLSRLSLAVNTSMVAMHISAVLGLALVISLAIRKGSLLIFIFSVFSIYAIFLMSELTHYQGDRIIMAAAPIWSVLYPSLAYYLFRRRLMDRFGRGGVKPHRS